MKTAFYESHRDQSKHIYVSWDKQNTCAPHFHQQIEILVMLTGTAQVTINDRHFELQPLQTAIADSFDIHSYSHSSEHSSGVLLLPQRYLGNYINHKRGKLLSDSLITDPSVARHIISLLPTLSSPSANQLLLCGSIDSLLGTILTKIPLIKSDNNSNLDLMREVLLFLDKNLTQDLTIDSVAKEFGYSKHYFSRLFNRYTSHSFKDYLNGIRLTRALDLMTKHHQKPIDAAFMSGFRSIQTFYRCFKDKYNTSPARAEAIISNTHN